MSIDDADMGSRKNRKTGMISIFGKGNRLSF